MLLQHIVTATPDRIGIRSTEHKHPVTLGAGQYLIEAESDLGTIPSTVLIRLHNHLHDEGWIKRQDADTLGRIWAALGDSRKANAPGRNSLIKQSYEPDPVAVAQEAAEMAESALERPARREVVQRAPRESSKPTSAPRAKPVAPGSKAKMVGDLLLRPEGCTTADILAATGWPSVSVPAQAKSCGLELRKEKVDGVTRYWGTSSQ